MSEDVAGEVIYPAVSSDTLFHFTPKLENLISILENNFRPRYCLEVHSCLEPNYSGLGPVLDFAIPMVCFCDIPLSLTAKHLTQYGRYGIGMTKEWGKKKGLNPVLYVHTESKLRAAMKENIKIANKLDSQIYRANKNVEALEALKDTNTLAHNFDYLTFFTKPYEGPFPREGRPTQDVRFYDEREWRYVPQKPNGWKQYIHRPAAENAQSREQHNSAIWKDEKAILKFSPKDIRYIIVSTEKELLPLVKHIDIIKEKFSENNKLLLKTRLISAEQIIKDF